MNYNITGNLFHAGIVAPVLWYAGMQQNPEWLKYVAVGVFVTHVWLIYSKSQNSVINKTEIGYDDEDSTDYSPIPQITRTKDSPSEYY
jgi:hypothetical protein